MDDINIEFGSTYSLRKPVLSLILCSRNDQYMGNSVWRLQTTLNYTCQQVHEAGVEGKVEILVTDWGSEVPLNSALRLNTVAGRIVKFIHIPPKLARDLQRDSPFPEVLALNAAARRALGQFIGRIDQDTLVGKRFLESFFELYDGRKKLGLAMSSGLFFANQRMVPYRFCVRCPSLWAVEKYIRYFGQFLKIEISASNPFYHHGVGIWFLHRDLWNECGGYDERMIYMNSMESNMIARLMKKYEIVNWGKLVGYDFYHLEHYHPWIPRRSYFYRKVNPWLVDSVPLYPNDNNWGLIQYPLEPVPYLPPEGKPGGLGLDESRSRWPAFIFLISMAGAQIGVDKLLLLARAASEPSRRFLRTWRRRSKRVWETVSPLPLKSWPSALWRLYRERESREVAEGQVKGLEGGNTG